MKQGVSDRILLFLKTPAKGRVKTRLASAVGEDDALLLYRNFILDILDTIGNESIACELCYTPPDSGPALIEWLGPGHQYRPQEGGDIGERMKNAFRSIFLESFERAVLIGSDIPDLPGSLLRDAFAALGSHDAVIGPAADGGYYLVGFRNNTFLPQVFDGIPWSTDAVFACTMDILKTAGYSVRLLPVLNDLDTAQDLALFLDRNRAGLPGSRTLPLLRSILGDRFAAGRHPGTKEGSLDHE